MRKDVLHMLRRVWQVRSKLARIDACLEQLEADERLILDILLDDHNEKTVRICEEFGVSMATAYRYIDEVLEEIQNIFMENMVEIP